MVTSSRIVLQKVIKDHSVVLRTPVTSDAIPLADYWFGAASAHLHPYLDLSALGTREKMLQRLEKSFAACPDTGPSPVLISDVDGRPSGSVLINQVVPQEEALVHVHIWNPSLRRIGMAREFAPEVLDYFLHGFQLKKLVMQVPAENLPAIHLLESIGMTAEGIFWGKAAAIVKDGNYLRFTYMGRKPRRKQE